MNNLFSIEEVSAHCDLPCGIYDPISAQISALSVIRVIDLMNGLENDGSLEFANTISRQIAVKEEEIEKLKNEIRIIWGDFIKPPMIKKYPNIHELTHKIMALGSFNRQHVSREKALELLELVNEFAEIFWALKEVETKRVKSLYAPNEEIVVAKY